MPLLAVIGHPVAHSRSPAMQTAALELLGLAEDWSYGAIDVEPSRLEELLEALAEGGEYAGLNVTVPHKEQALALAHEASERAAAIGAANTLSFERGRVVAENTDAPGIVAALPRAAEGTEALVLGAGGSARAAAWALADAGASVTIWNRTAKRAAHVADELGVRHLEGGGEEEPLPLGSFDVIVNCTSVGLETPAGERAGDVGDLKRLRVDADLLEARHVVVDLVYGDRPTALTSEAKARGAAVVDGISVLVHQGAESLRIWTGREPPVAAMNEAARS